MSGSQIQLSWTSLAVVTPSTTEVPIQRNSRAAGSMANWAMSYLQPRTVGKEQQSVTLVIAMFYRTFVWSLELQFSTSHLCTLYSPVFRKKFNHSQSPRAFNISTTWSTVPTSLLETLASGTQKGIFEVINKNVGATLTTEFFFDTFSSVLGFFFSIWSQTSDQLI